MNSNKLSRKELLSAFNAAADYCDQAAKLYSDGAALVAARSAGLDERQAGEFITKVNSLRKRLEGFQHQLQRASLAIQRNPRLVNKAVRKASARFVKARRRYERAVAAYATAVGDAAPSPTYPFPVITSSPKHDSNANSNTLYVTNPYRRLAGSRRNEPCPCQ